MTKKGEIDGRTRRAADIALAKRTISRASYDALLAGELSLADVTRLGRDGGPTPRDTRGGQERATETPREGREPRPCICCGAMTKGGRFHAGCDAKMHRLAREYVRGERELTEEQLAYVRDETDKLVRARARVAREAGEGNGA